MLVETFESETPLGKPRKKWEDSAKMNLKEMEFEVLNWTEAAHDGV
jgi:hypothetical protein